jgi:hypothetical protein
MNADTKPQPPAESNRRRFLGAAVQGLSLAGIGAACGWLAPRTKADQPLKVTPGAGRTLGKEFTYDVSALRKTDPQLLRCDPVAEFHVSFKEPGCVAAGPDQSLLVAGGSSLSVLTLSGEVKTTMNLPGEVRAVCAGPDRAIYAALSDRVCVLDAAGRPVATWKLSGKTPILTSIVAGEQDVFVGDAANRVVLRLNHEGVVVNSIGKKDIARGIPGLVLPSAFLDLVLGQDGMLWVTNTGRHLVEAYTFSGDLEYSWGESSNAIHGFCGCCNPVHLAQLPDGRFITSEKGLPRIKLYSNRGEFEGVVAGPETFSRYWENPQAKPVGLDVAVDGQGRIVVADPLVGVIRIFGLRPNASKPA